MADSSQGLEPAYSNLIDHLDMIGVRASPRFLAGCVRDAKRAGAGDAQIHAAFLASLGALSGRALTEAEQRELGERFHEQLRTV